MTDAHRQPDLPKTKRRRRSPHGPGLFVTDTELVEMLGIPRRQAMAMLQALDENGGRKYGFPQKQAVCGDRRFLPAVTAYFEQRYGLKMHAPQPKERQRG